MKKRRPQRRGRKSPRKPDDLDVPPARVHVDRLAAGGDGVAKLSDGLTLFVPFSAPGDEVDVRVDERHKRWARGHIVERITPAPSRVEPACVHFETCGGCAWQHLDYPAQLDAKAQILRDALVRIGRVEMPNPPAMTASPTAYGTRVRARLVAARGRLGYRERRAHRICPISECPVLSTDLEKAVLSLAAGEALGGVRLSDAPDAEWLFSIGDDGSVSCIAERADVTSEPAASVEVTTSAGVLRVAADAFSQANRPLYDALLARVIAQVGAGESLADPPGVRCLELHAGIGFFTTALLDCARSLVAVEPSPTALRLLRENMATRVAARPDAFEVVASTFAEASGRWEAGAFDTVFLDPPRTGLEPDERKALVRLSPDRIVYLSCDPATLARDVGVLVEGGFEVAEVEGFDLFPQTPHVEALVRLERRGPRLD